MSGPRLLSRRGLLRLGGVTLAGGLAGCSSSEEPGDEADEPYLEILDHEATEEWVVTGRAENASDQTLETAQVEARFTDETGSVLDTEFDRVSDLAPGERWRFTMEAGGKFHDVIQGYYLETTAVPE